MEDVILFVAQISSVITSIVGILALLFLLRSLRHLTEEAFKNNLRLYTIAFVFIVAGVVAMTMYHLFEDTSLSSLGELLEKGWYILMFAGFAFLIFESLEWRGYLKRVDARAGIVRQKAAAQKSAKRPDHKRSAKKTRTKR